MTLEAQNIHTETIATVAKPEKLPGKKEEGGLLTINGTLFVIIASFVIFVLLMQKVFYGPVTQIRQRRSDYVKSMKEEANEAFQEAETLNSGYQESLKDARKKVSENTSDLLNEANEEKCKILESKKQEISGYLNEQKQVIQDEKVQAIEALKGQILDYACNISRKILGEDVSMEGLSPEIVDKALNR